MGTRILKAMAVAVLAPAASGDVISFDDYREPRGYVDSVEAIHEARSARVESLDGPFLRDPFFGMALGPLAHPASLPDQEGIVTTDDSPTEPPLFAPRRHDLWTGIVARSAAIVF